MVNMWGADPHTPRYRVAGGVLFKGRFQDVKSQRTGAGFVPRVVNGDVKRLTHFTPGWRLRVGDWRVLFDVNGTVIVVWRVVHRSQAYD